MRMRKKCKKLDNRGMAMVLVIVAIALVMILVSVLMSISLLNYQMKVTEKQAKENFYSAETVLDQIHSGLRQEVSSATGTAYTKAMQTYKMVDETTREQNFKASYITSLRSAIGTPASDEKYYVGVDSDIDTTTGLCTKGLAKYLDSYLAGKLKDGSLKLSTTNGAVEGNLISNSDGLILKGLVVEFIDNNGFYSKIQTDIVIGFPDITLKEYAILPNVFDYALIADSGIVVNGAADVNLRSNAYAGANGVDVKSGTKMNVEDVDYLVSKGDIVLDNTSSFNMTGGELWCQSIEVQGSSMEGTSNHMALQLDNETYVADDLTISGWNSAVTLQGKYYGYGSPEVNPDTTIADADKSSAIIMNCRNSLLNMTGLEELMLCGNAYINGKNIIYTEASDPEVNKNENQNILLGNSLAVKSDQIALLVPPECLGTLTNDSTGTTLLVGKNPMSDAEYVKWSETFPNNYALDADNTYQKLDVNVVVPLLGKSLSSYGIGSNDIQTIRKSVKGESIVYVYLKLNEETAAAYYKDYLAAANQVMTSYAKKYRNSIYLNTGYTTTTTSGNLMTYSYNGAGTMSMSLVERSITTETEASVNATQEQYTDKFKALCSKLVSNYSSLTTTETTQTVYENLIQTDKVSALTETKTYTASGYKAVVTNSPTTVIPNGTDIKLLITSGDVQINGSFSGMIIAGGTVTIESGTTEITTDKEKITNLLKLKVAEEDGGKSFVETYFVNGDRYVLSESGDGNAAYVDFEQLIAFRNWTKQ